MTTVTGPTIRDLFRPTALNAAVAEGYVRRQVHPTEPLAILNYTEKTAFDGAWDEVTLACRGLIYHTETLEVVARPFKKFFNFLQTGAPAVDLDAEVVVTDKMDGCFPRGTALNLWGGGTITIDKVVRERLPVTLVGMNERGEIVPALVTDWHNNGRKDHWLDIEVDARVSRRSGAAGHPNRLRVTVNHQVHANGRYRPACEVKPGDLMVTQAWRPSEDVLHLVRSSLLGDGSLTASVTKPGRAKYQESHSEKQADYVHAIRKALGSCAANRSDTVSGYGSVMVWAGSREYAALGEMRAEWYRDGVKRVPDDLSWVDDFTVAKWLMDDGYRQHFGGRQADRVSFATHSFARPDIERLGQRLAAMYGVTYFLHDDSGKGFALVVNSGRRQEIQRLWQAVAPHVHPSMRYKLPEPWRDVPYEEMPVGMEEVYSAPATVLSVAPVEPTERNFPSGRTGYDVTTTTHNYLARGVLVHNSLGILYPLTTSGWAIATRGSFVSEQAQHGTEVWQQRYANRVEPVPGVTYLFEVVYPANRIVVDYGDLDDLVLLGVVDIANGRTLPTEPLETWGWPGPVAEMFPYRSLVEALAAPSRANREGLVVHFVRTDDRLKIKQADYVALHRIVTGLSERTVWQHLVDGKPLDELVEPLPDEFHPWVRDVAERITTSVQQEIWRLEDEYTLIRAAMPDTWQQSDPTTRAGRAELARVAAKHPDSWAMFALLDGRDIRPRILANAKPEAFLTPSGRTYTEDNA